MPEKRNNMLVVVFLCSVLQLLVTANVLSSAILAILMMEAILSSETSALTRATQHNIQKTAFFGRCVLTQTVIDIQLIHPVGNGMYNIVNEECGLLGCYAVWLL
jgi:hypothetical protein